jgi:hypothetical protein
MSILASGVQEGLFKFQQEVDQLLDPKVLGETLTFDDQRQWKRLLDFGPPLAGKTEQLTPSEHDSFWMQVAKDLIVVVVGEGRRMAEDTKLQGSEKRVLEGRTGAFLIMESSLNCALGIGTVRRCHWRGWSQRFMRACSARSVASKSSGCVER